MKKILFTLFSLVIAISASATIDAQYSFEGQVPSFISRKGGAQISLSAEKYKDGKESMKFTWLGQAELSFNNTSDIQASMKVKDAGMMVWIYNTAGMDAPLRFTFRDAAGTPICWFDFNMNFTGWRTAWIKYVDMLSPYGHFGDIPHKERNLEGTRMTITTPPTCPTGTVYIDRLSFSTKKLNNQITPDQQIPENNYNLDRVAMWHWCRTWEWSQYPELDTPQINDVQAASLAMLEKRLDEMVLKTSVRNQDQTSPAYINKNIRPKIKKNMTKFELRRLPDGSVSGHPLLSDDEYNADRGEMKIRNINDLAWWCAYDYLYTGNPESVETAMIVFDHALDQGFAYGSGQGTNHHYGYQVRDLYKALWVFRDEFTKAGKMDSYVKALTYWSALAEVRKPLEGYRDELLDSWHTLHTCKVICAMLQKDDNMKYAYMKALTDWTDRSMMCTDGTLGGFKVDGTSFHHGGHYPAYSVGAFGELGFFCSLIDGTDLELGTASRKCFKKCLLTLRNYCQEKDWGFGVSGRHPFGGHIPDNDREAFARLAALGDLTGNGCAVDPELASAYLALGGSDRRYVSAFKKAGIKATTPADGFSVYNYGAFGIHRRDGWMLTLKGFNTDVWGSEIYTHDNRYGRYMSYGSAQLIDADSAKESGYNEDGWDWNRIPGVTSIHLPFELLESPNKGTLMERNDSRFPGVSSLEGMNGCLAFTYVEKDRVNFCPGATATKSVFCFDNRIVHIGTGISNNSTYPTETVLYQLNMEDTGVEIDINDSYSTAFPYDYRHDRHEQVVLTDIKDNYYIIKDGFGLNVEKKPQMSPYDTKKKTGSGNFASAVINHGTAPSGASYEYMLLVKPSMKEVSKYSRKLPYEVICADNDAHVVKDEVTGITAYISYKGFGSSETLVSAIEAETIVMERTRKDGSIVMSICTPDLGITEKSYTTRQASQPLVKTVTLNGTHSLAGEYGNVTLTVEGGKTIVKATCLHGQPVEFTLK